MPLEYFHSVRALGRTKVTEVTAFAQCCGDDSGDIAVTLIDLLGLSGSRRLRRNHAEA